MDVAVWLRSLGLGKYEAAFRENEIGETVLPGLTAEDLKELGIAALGHRRKLLDAIGALKAAAADATTLTAPSASPEDRAPTPASHRYVLRLSRLNRSLGPNGP
jgi:SAM (Sterile alpha motif) domain-containing protein